MNDPYRTGMRLYVEALLNIPDLDESLCPLQRIAVQFNRATDEVLMPATSHATAFDIALVLLVSLQSKLVEALRAKGVTSSCVALTDVPLPPSRDRAGCAQVIAALRRGLGECKGLKPDAPEDRQVLACAVEVSMAQQILYDVARVEQPAPYDRVLCAMSVSLLVTLWRIWGPGEVAALWTVLESMPTVGMCASPSFPSPN